MRYILPVEKIQETETHRRLVREKEFIKISFLENRTIREKITNGFMIYKNTGTIPPHITGINLQVIKDLIVLEDKEKARAFVPANTEGA